MHQTAQGVSDLDEDESVYYTGYKKIHGIKLSVIVCVMSGWLLDIAISPASSSDSDVFEVHQRNLLSSEAALFGDKAYNGCIGVFSPVKDSDLSVINLRVKCGVRGARAELARALSHNTGISRYRSRVEQAIGELSEWACTKRFAEVSHVS